MMTGGKSEEKYERRVTKNRELAARLRKQSERKASPCRLGVLDNSRAAFLDEGVFTEILLRLPVKSVIAFQSVCKSWLSLISSDYFRRLHTLHRRPAPPPPSLAVATREWQLISPKMTLFCSNPKVTISYSDPITKRTKKMNIIPFDINNFEMLSCSNGLMLLQCKDCSDYYIYNPATKQSKTIRPPKSEKINQVLSVHLVFDPSKSPHYKIICIRTEEEEETLLLHKIEVFESGSGTWRVCVEPFITNDEIMNFTSCVECKNFIYLFLNHIYFPCVFLFDITKKDSHLIACPVPELAKGAYSHTIQASNDCIYYCALLKDGPCKSSAALWELQVNEEDPRGSTWLLKYRRSVRRLEGGMRFDILTYIAETSTVLIHAPGKILAFNFLRRTYKKILGLNYQISSVKIFKLGETLALI